MFGFLVSFHLNISALIDVGELTSHIGELVIGELVVGELTHWGDNYVWE